MNISKNISGEYLTATDVSDGNVVKFLNEDQSKILQAVKRAYKRSDLAKSKEVKR